MMFFNNNELKKLCELEVQLEEGNLTDTFFLNKAIRGNLKLSPKSDLIIYHLGCQLIVEARGKIINYNQTIVKKILANQRKLQKGKTYSFQFEVINKTHENYTGINTNYHIKLEFFLRLKHRELAKKERGFLSKMNHLLKWDDQYKSVHYLQFKPPNQSYQVRLINEKMEMKYSYSVQLVLLAVIILLIIMTFSNGTSSYVLIGITLVLFVSVIYFLLLEQIIGPIKVEYTKESMEEQFGIRLSNTKNWKNVNQLSVKYEVREEVVDQRGTTNVTLTEAVYVSEEKSIKNPTKKVHLPFNFPNDVLGTTRIQDSKIYWTSVVKVKTIWGFYLIYENEFTAVKS